MSPSWKQFRCFQSVAIPKVLIYTGGVVQYLLGSNHLRPRRKISGLVQSTIDCISVHFYVKGKVN